MVGVVLLGGIQAPQRKMSFSSWNKDFSNQNQRNPSVSSTGFRPNLT